MYFIKLYVNKNKNSFILALLLQLVQFLFYCKQQCTGVKIID